MKLSIAALIALSCIWNVSGKLLEVEVRLGDNATLPCDCELIIGQDVRWVKIWPPQIQQPLTISGYNSLFEPIPRFSLSWNNTSKSYDLEIENITESDLGLYYCSKVETKWIEEEGKMIEKDLSHAADTVINLTYGSTESPPEPVSDCWQCWMILQAVCPACSILSVILAFVCGYSCCHKTVLKESEGHQNSSEMQRQLSQEEDVHREVCYASLYIPKRGNQRTKSNRLPNEDFSVYNDIKMHT